MPLSTYENIIPQCGEIVKRLTAVFKKISGDFFCLGGGHFFTLNAERVISVLFSLITSTEYIKSATNYYLSILSLYISLILLYLYIIYIYTHIKFTSNIYSLLVIS